MTNATLKGEPLGSRQTTRRTFLAGAAAMGLGTLVGYANGTPKRDERLSVFLSDMHVPGVGTELDKHNFEPDPEYMFKKLAEAVDEVIAMRPQPARVVVFGDIAYLRGEKADYEKSKPLFDRLVAAGIDVVFGLGNHDHRAAFFETYPEWKARTAVPGEVVSKVSLGDADLLLLDTLTENLEAPGVPNVGTGSVSARQFAWLKREAAQATRPFFVGGHHPTKDLTNPSDKSPLSATLLTYPLFRGYIHGHNHFWKTDVMRSWQTGAVRRVATLPSVGFWGDLGYATFRTTPQMAELKPTVREFCFPRHQLQPAKDQAVWQAIVEDAQRECCHFPL